MKEEPRNCPDCAAEPRKPHEPGCDVERCSLCGGQVISCGCDHNNERDPHDPLFARWTGFWPGYLESQALGIDLNEFHRKRLNLNFFVKPKEEKAV